MIEPASASSQAHLGGRGVVLVLLAHQDDEVAFSPIIALVRAQGRPLRVVYLTNGGARSQTPARRAAESERALAALGVPRSEIRFLGTDLSIPDGELFRHFPSSYSALLDDCRDIHDLGAVLTLAWEGGHPDHDATHVLAMKLARERGADDRTWQVPFYRAADRGVPFFSMFAPLTCNGPVQELPAAHQDALLRAAMMRYYRSQWRTFAGLGPAILWHALIGTPARIQKVQVRRTLGRPTAGPLLYERRNRISFAEFAEHANSFLEQSVSAGSHRS
ncbi:MAG: PIG-L family deacetylase [Gammaproteobacteria bacterium]|nr:PIG-L family deacetylase [Gammaproteobacteria bacterium]MDH5272960.1 PIG-L family deacetylase [Gammaproteobacteria bacterium]